jgi:glucosamine-6-phosphate deaminase
LLKRPDAEVQCLQREKLKLEIYPTREEAGAAAANAAAKELNRLSQQSGHIGVIFATGASQLATLGALRRIPGLPWDRLRGFHMDEYVGISPDHRASFRRYLRTELTDQVQMDHFYEIDGYPAPERECTNYADLLRLDKPQLCLLGIGENGHLAFNDPGVADFDDPLDMKIVDLDDDCKRQQVAEGWFANLDEVPEQALTLTIPALFRVPKLIVSVPGRRKAAIVKRTLNEAISTTCPATILRTHPDATVYLDADSAAELDGKDLLNI